MKVVFENCQKFVECACGHRIPTNGWYLDRLWMMVLKFWLIGVVSAFSLVWVFAGNPLRLGRHTFVLELLEAGRTVEMHGGRLDSRNGEAVNHYIWSDWRGEWVHVQAWEIEDRE